MPSASPVASQPARGPRLGGSMHSPRSLLRHLLLIACLIVISTSSATAQVLNQGSQPALTPNTSIHGSNIDVVSLSNGTLHIEIPILEVVNPSHKLRCPYIYN